MRGAPRPGTPGAGEHRRVASGRSTGRDRRARARRGWSEIRARLRDLETIRGSPSGATPPTVEPSATSAVVAEQVRQRSMGDTRRPGPRTGGGRSDKARDAEADRTFAALAMRRGPPMVDAVGKVGADRPHDLVSAPVEHRGRSAFGAHQLA